MHVVYLLVGSYIFILWCSYVLNNLVHQHQLNKNCKLFDIIHEYLPDLSRYYHVVDYMVLFMLLGFIAFVTYKKDWDLMQQFFICLAMIFVLKYIMQLVTILPDPTVHNDQTCDQRYASNSYIRFLVGYCNDMIFSGHTAVCILTVFALVGHVSPLVLWLLTGYAASVGYLSIAVKNHYTIDVLVAFLAVYFVWNILYKK